MLGSAPPDSPSLAAPSPTRHPQRLNAYLGFFRAAAAHLLGTYRTAWAAVPDASAAGTGPGEAGIQVLPEDQAVAGIGVRAWPVAAARPLALLPPASGILADLDLDAAAEAIVAAAWWSTVDPQVAVCFGCIHDDAGRRYPSLAALSLLLQPWGLSVPLALPADSGPVADGLLRPVTDADAPVRLTDTAALLLDGWRPQPASATRPPARLRGVVAQCAALLRAGQRVALRCADADDARTLPQWVAARLGCALDEPNGRPLAETALLARLGLILPGGSHSENPASRLRVAEPGASCGRDWQVIDVAAIDIHAVRKAWRQVLSNSGLPPRAADELAARLRLSESAIDDLHQTAAAAARVGGRRLVVADLHDAVRRHPQHSLDSMARLLAPSLRLADLVVTQDTRDGLTDLLAHARYTGAVTAQWPGIRGRAVVALLHGPSGTGKTAAAEALASELDRDLWIVDLAQVVSKWLGETQRNLDRLLTEAARAGAILLFDEAEGLFGRRAEISDARDRYANLEIDHLLQRIELHEGLVILTSNRPAGLDHGFQRRLRASIRFELPDHAARQQIWRALLPGELLAPGTSIERFAEAELSGGSVRAAALSARVFAAADRTAVSDEHLHRAVRRELEKSGRSWTTRGGAR